MDETQIVKREDMTMERLVERDRFETALAAAKAIHASAMFPEYRSPEQIYVACLWAEENNVPKTTALRQVHFIKGRLVVEADLMKGMVKRLGCGRFEYEQGEGTCTLTAERLDTGEMFTTTWNRARAAKANLTNKDNYRNYEAEMLRHRCDAEACRALWPDIVGGLYVTEEAAEIQDAQLVEKPKVGAALAAEALGIEVPDDSGGSDVGDAQSETPTDKAPEDAPQASTESGGAVVLIPDGPVMGDNPKFALFATVGPVPIGRHQTDKLIYFCGECGELNVGAGESCPHVEAMKGA